MKDSEFRKKLGVIRNAVENFELGEGEKKALGQALKGVLRAVGKGEGWQAGEFEVRYNPGGSAVKGDGTLHGPDLYVSVSPDGAGPGVLVRNCQGTRDFQGGPNGWMSWNTFLEAENADQLRASIRQIAPKQMGSVAPKLALGKEPAIAPQTRQGIISPGD
jgi:hypothetical protein